MYGFNGKVLKVNLTNGDVEVRKLDEDIYRRYLGGRGLALYFLLREMKPRVDPLGPDNVLVFTTSVVTGVPLPGFGRFTVAAKSPLTDGFGEAEAGGYWGAELKFSGFDAIIVRGASDKPVYLWIHDGEADIRDARKLWGMTTKGAQDSIREELNDKLIRVAAIGQAGENLVRFACILNEARYASGRCGLGAVMGSKKLKAIAVRGHGRVTVKSMDEIRGLAKWFDENWRNNPSAVYLSGYGTAGIVTVLDADGILPTKNFRDGSFEHAEEISGERMKETILIGTEGCFACPVKCKRVVKLTNPYQVDPEYGGPEYETIAALGSLCGIGDLNTIAYGNQLCNAYGMDTISTGCVIAFAMECYEKGIITREDTGGLDLKFGNREALIQLIHMIAKRSGIGDVLAEGVLRASKRIGRGSENMALHVKGKEVPLHDPRGKASLALMYAISPSGADHMQAVHDPVYEQSVESMKCLGILKPIDRLSLDAEKVRAFTYLHILNSLYDCLDVCKFIFTPHVYGTFKITQLPTILNAITGWETSLFELMKVGERALNMARAFNVREGLDVKEDRLPHRFFEALNSGSRKGAKLDAIEFNEALKTYYKIMGWDEVTGAPEEAKLKELDLEWVIDIMSQHC